MGARVRLPAPAKKWLQPTIDFWSEAIWVDYALALFALTVHICIIRTTRHGDWLLWIKSEQRTSVYATGAAIISAIGALSAIAITVYMSAEGERARAVKKLYHGELRRNWRSLLAATGLAAILCLISQSIDVDKDPHKARFLFEFALFLAIFRFIRLLWLFDQMMSVWDKDANDEDPERIPAPKYDPGWAD